MERQWGLFQEHIVVSLVSRITPAQTSARFYRKPRSSKTRSNLVARGPGLEEQPPALYIWFVGHRGVSGKAVRTSHRPGQLQASQPGSHGPAPGAHHAVLLPSAWPCRPPCTSVLRPPPRLLSSTGAPELGSWDWGHLRHRRLARVLPCLCPVAPYPLCFHLPLGPGQRR